MRLADLNTMTLLDLQLAAARFDGPARALMDDMLELLDEKVHGRHYHLNPRRPGDGIGFYGAAVVVPS